MQTSFKKLTSSLSVAILSTSISIGLVGCPTSTTNNNGNNGTTTEVVEIDVNMPMTGPIGFFGVNLQEGATMALEDLEQDASNPIELVFDWQDNAADQAATVSIFQKQFLDEPDIYVSGLPVQNLAISDQVSSKNTPHFVWQFDTKINNKSDDIPDNRLRTLLNFKLESEVYLDFIKSKEPKKIAIVYVNIPSLDEQFNQILKPQIEEMGIDSFIEPYEIAINDYKSLAAKVEQYQPDVLILSGFQDNLVGLIRAVRPLGLIKDDNTMAGYDLLDAATILGSDEIEGIHVTAPIFISKSDQANIAEWITRFEDKYQKTPDYNSAYAYDMVSIIYDAAQRLDDAGNLPATPEQWLESLLATNMQGITGSLKFDDDGSLVTPMDLTVYRDGKLVSLKSFTFD